MFQKNCPTCMNTTEHASKQASKLTNIGSIIEDAIASPLFLSHLLHLEYFHFNNFYLSFAILLEGKKWSLVNKIYSNMLGWILKYCLL